MRKFAVLLTHGRTGLWSAFVPDLPACNVVVGRTQDEAIQMVRDAIILHYAVLTDNHMPLPEPSTLAITIEVK